MGTQLTRRRFLSRAVLGGCGLGLIGLVGACGQAEPAQGQPVGARVAQTPGATLTPPSGTPVNTTPLPTIEGTVILPTPVLSPNTGPQFRPTLPPVLTPTIYPTGRPEDPYCYGSYGARPAPDTARSVQNSTAVLIGRVRELQAARWTTLDGNRPANPHAGPPYYHIFTPVVIDLESQLKGTSPQQLTLFVPVGTIGQDCARSSDFRMNVQAGERTVLFLRPSLFSAQIGTGYWDFAERYVITADGTTNNGLRSLPLQQLLDEINAVPGSPQPTPQATSVP